MEGDEQVAIQVLEPEMRLGALQIKTPEEIIVRASAVAKSLADIVNKQKMYTVIGGKKHVHVDGWSTMGAMLGVVPREVEVKEHENGDYEATVELVRVNDGAIIGRGSALCGCDEKDRNGKAIWGDRAKYARRSMAITRAAGKAFRLSFSWIMKLAGYEACPAEEIIDGEVAEPQKQPSPPASAPQPVENGGNGNATKTWSTELITWAVQEYKVKPQRVVAALNKSTMLKADSTPIEVQRHWMAVYRTERANGVDSDEAAKRADADFQAIAEST
jgi:hypothetical protein